MSLIYNKSVLRDARLRPSNTYLSNRIKSCEQNQGLSAYSTSQKDNPLNAYWFAFHVLDYDSD